MNINCKNEVIYCECCKTGFIDKSSLISHLTKSNLSCRQYYDRKALSNSVASSFSTSEVNMIKSKNSTTEITSELFETNLKLDANKNVCNKKYFKIVK